MVCGQSSYASEMLAEPEDSESADLSAQYAVAWDEWTASGEEAIWDAVTADGLPTEDLVIC